MERTGVWLWMVGRMPGSSVVLEGTGRSPRAVSPTPGSSRVLERIGM
ncbi:hypothetical protein OG601_26635 [Streptomyces sp. NBC_01239]|nr:hypothetical protein [Streptomyces sp. NBC_01239]MCX4814178.1 hypothetical protein [Streptomyces sp. NBC_01239]